LPFSSLTEKKNVHISIELIFKKKQKVSTEFQG